jgi:hypothetical protein
MHHFVYSGFISLPMLVQIGLQRATRLPDVVESRLAQFMQEYLDQIVFVGTSLDREI